MDAPPHQNDTNQVVWLGDFNRHHPLWDNSNSTWLFTTANLDTASLLVDLISTFRMEMLLPAGIPTIKTFRMGSMSRPDNVFCSSALLQAFIECNTKPELHPACTDHFQITGVIDIDPNRVVPPSSAIGSVSNGMTSECPSMRTCRF